MPTTSVSPQGIAAQVKTKKLLANIVNQTGIVPLTFASSIAIDASQSNIFSLTLTGNLTLLPIINPQYDQQEIKFILTQDATGSRTLSLTTGSAGSFSFGTSLTSVTLSTAANKIDYLTVKYNLAANKWHVSSFSAGF